MRFWLCGSSKSVRNASGKLHNISFRYCKEALTGTKCFNHLSANHSKWSDTLKQFVGCCRQIVSVCVTILWGWCLKGFNEHIFVILRVLSLLMLLRTKQWLQLTTMEQRICIYQIEKEPNTVRLWRMFYIITMMMEREGKLKWKWLLPFILFKFILCLNARDEN